MSENTHEAPQSRVEAILQSMLGEDVTLEEPQSRIEALLMEILEQGGSGGGGGGSAISEDAMIDLSQFDELSELLGLIFIVLTRYNNPTVLDGYTHAVTLTDDECENLRTRLEAIVSNGQIPVLVPYPDSQYRLVAAGFSGTDASLGGPNVTFLYAHAAKGKLYQVSLAINLSASAAQVSVWIPCNKDEDEEEEPDVFCVTYRVFRYNGELTLRCDKTFWEIRDALDSLGPNSTPSTETHIYARLYWQPDGHDIYLITNSVDYYSNNDGDLYGVAFSGYHPYTDEETGNSIGNYHIIHGCDATGNGTITIEDDGLMSMGPVREED